MLMPEQKARRQQYIAKRIYRHTYKTNPEGFYSRICISDETRVLHHDPESKQKSMQWEHRSLTDS